MKKLLTLALALVALAAFTGLGAAQEKKGGEKSKPTGVEMKQPATGEKKKVKGNDTTTYKMTGKVIRDNQSGKTFTVMAKGKEVTFNAAKLKVLPKVGKIIDITYTQNPGGPMEATTINVSKSNTY